MNAKDRPTDAGLEPTAVKTSPHISASGQIDRLCDDFERRWQRGERPQIESFLEGLDANVRGALLQELILLEIEYRSRDGETINREEYLGRFRDDVANVSLAFDRSTATTTRMHVPTGPSAPRGENISAAVRYRDLTFHAEGGLGEVYRATDDDLRRQVAIKFIKARHLSDAECRSRFAVEAEVTGRLDHPGVAPVYARGEGWDGRPFYAMRFIEGITLRQAIDDFHKTDWDAKGQRARRLELHRLLGHLVAACNTVAYAHNRGIVHRDIKPENIMLGKFRETLVVDWGLAVSVTRDERAKASGENTLMVGEAEGSSSAASVSGAGTIGYASPEQLSLSEHPVSPLSDVYSFGASLYKLLVGTAPFQGRPNQELMNKIRFGNFTPPKAANDKAPKALEAICLKAMASEPAARYASLMELSDDLQAWLSDEPISIYREPLFERLARSARRHRTWTKSILGASIAVIGVALASAVWLSSMAAERKQALVDARLSRENGVRVAAQFAASTLANEIDVRWRILEQEVADGELRDLILKADGKPLGTPERAAVQQWLESRFNKHQKSIEYESWSLTDATGKQLARAPKSSDTIDRNFAHRDYFHGKGEDAKPGEAAEMKPLTDVHRSVVYQSQANGEFKVGFSVPVWGDRSEPLPSAVLTMSVPLGRFKVLSTDVSRDQFAVLVETRSYDYTGRNSAGLILQHPELARRITDDGKQSLVAIDPQHLEGMERLRRIRLRENGSGGKSKVNNLETKYLDPAFGEKSPVWVAAYEPVLIDGRSESNRDTGWCVLIQQRAEGGEEDNGAGSRGGW